MEDGFNVQKKFFQELKIKLPSNYSMANVVADELCISIDSAYRRIRGESDLSFREFDILSSKYQISTDAVLSKSHHSINFTHPSLSQDPSEFNLYFNSIFNETQSLIKFGLKEIIYTAMDLPISYYFMYPKLASFKIFALMKNGSKSAIAAENQYQPGIVNEEDLTKIHKLQQSYLSVPTIEIWCEETLNTTLRQISFYEENGTFEKKKDILDILDELKKVIGHIQIQAELGYKFTPGNDHIQEFQNDNFKMYFNEIPLTENMTLLKLENSNMVQLGNDPIHRLTTSNEDFFQDNYAFIQKVIENATCISVYCQKERKQSFNLLYHKIDTYIANL
jgi:hypothetical protein